MFSKTCEYAIRAMIYIAQKGNKGQKVSIKDIAKGIDSPEFFIAKILQMLSRQGLVSSTKGPNGGFYFDSALPKCSIADIVKAIDGDKIFTSCGLGLTECSEEKPCPIHDKFKVIRKQISAMLEQAKVNDFNAQIENELAFLKRN